jgi:hypothetical protein
MHSLDTVGGKPSLPGQQTQRGHAEDVRMFDEKLFSLRAVSGRRLTIRQLHVHDALSSEVSLAFPQHLDWILDVLKHFVEGDQVVRLQPRSRQKIATDGVDADVLPRMIDGARVRIKSCAFPPLFLHASGKHAKTRSNIE